MSRKGKEKENQNPQDKTPYITVQQRLARHIQSGRSWLAQEKQWLQPYDAQGVSVDKQLPVYQPNKKIVVMTRKTFSFSLTRYLEKEQKQHSGQRRLLSIPVYIDDHWAVLTLYINEHDQLHSAAYIDSIQPNQQHPTPLPTQHLIVCAIKETYPNYQGTVLQHQYYHHSDKTLSASIMPENAEASIRRFYFGNRVPLRATLWTKMPTAQKSGISAFETELPVEVQMYALSFLGRRARFQFAQSSKNNAVLASDKQVWGKAYLAILANNQKNWKQLYDAWSRYLVIPTPHKKPPEPKCYKTAFKQLCLSLASKERKLIQAAVDGDQKILDKYLKNETRRKKYRHRLLVIATCHGDIALLKSLKCSRDNIKDMGLVSYSSHAKNRQAILNYFQDLPRNYFQDLPSCSNPFFAKNFITAHWAAMLNQPTRLKDILNENPRLMYQTNLFGITPLMFTKFYGHSECIDVMNEFAHKNSPSKFNLASKRILINADAESTVVLLQCGISPNQQLTNHWTALMKTAKFEHADIARLLLQHGADPDLQDCRGETALTYAILESKCENIVRLLLQHNANPNLRNKNCGTSALIRSVQCRKAKVASLLLQYGANPNLKDINGNTALKIAELYSCKPIIQLLSRHHSNRAETNRTETSTKNCK